MQTDTGQLSDRTKAALAELARAVPAMLDTFRNHRCAKFGCTEQIPIDRVACKSHWYELPVDLRSKFSPDMPVHQRALLFRECRLILVVPPKEPSHVE